MTAPTPDALVTTFDACFRDEHTVLRGGFPEPEYLPWRAGRPAELRFRDDHLASALHETAHWCIAGRARRRRYDFGYWYAPDGRDAATQARFLQVEVRPQALEWYLHAACGSRFHLSLDNLDGDAAAAEVHAFAAAVVAAARDCRAHGLPPRLARLCAALGGVPADFRPSLSALGIRAPSPSDARV